MTYLYVITDTNDDSKKVYSVTASDLTESRELFLKRFFPLLQDIETLDFKSLQNICKDFDYILSVIKPEEIICLD